MSNFSYVSPGASSLAVVERISGTDYTRASVSLSMSSGTAYRFEVSFRGSTVTVKRDGAVVLGSSALTRLSAGKAGVRVSRSYSGSSSWRDVTVVKTGVDQIASYDDFYPYGQVIEGRSFNAGLSDARYKYLAKEHDTETGLEWLEARGYDARIGRFLTVDPLAETARLRSWSPYHYAYDNPMRFADPTGMGPDRQWWQVLSDQWFGSSPFDNAQNGSSTSSTNGQGGNDLDQGSLPRPAVVNQTGGGTVTPYELKRRNASVGRVLLKTISAGVSSRRSLLPMSAKPALMSLVAVSIQPNVAIYLEPDGSQSADIDVFARSNASAYFKVSYTGSASLVMNDGVISSQGFEALPRPSLYDSDWSPVGHVSFALPQDRTRLEMDITVLPTLETTSTKGNWPLQSVSTTVKIR